MKLIFATVAFLIVSVSALRPFDRSQIDFKNEDSVVSYFQNAIQDLGESIRAAGWDPLYIERKQINYTLPVPVIYNSTYVVEDVLSTGLSGIVVKMASYNVDSSSLSFDIQLPFTMASFGNGIVETTFFGTTFKISSSGRVAIPRLRFVGQIGIDVNNSGVTVNSSNITFTMGGIACDVHLKIQDDDYSDMMNEFIFKNLPEKIKQYNNEINELFGILSKDYINDYLRAGKN
ncbi:hypothetical protein PYW07_014308 [Mythimna separata]|uniref:Uncharacterized protein n=1 Tax=Mythimna separata TaxID=271217 RepID=A0AAD7YY39_MYTSE|nr:hypothetical protein PYW07_014308 [Mythimna separata]